MRFIKRWRFLLFLPLFISLCLSSQDLELKSEPDRPGYLSPRIGFSLSGLINPFNHAATLTVEFPLTYEWRLEGELGYIFDSSNRAVYEGESNTGFRTRVAVKYYIDDGFYGRLAFKFDQTNSSNYYTLLSPGTNYEVWHLSERTIRRIGATMFAGYDIELTQNRRWVLDLSIGAGILNFKPQNEVEIPDDFQFIDPVNRSLLVVNNELTTLDFSFSVQLEFLLRK